MSIALRDYQKTLKAAIYSGWSAGHKNILATLPTGGGKTAIFSKIIEETKAPCCAIAHRRELVGQISLALARNGIKHYLIAPDSVRREIIGMHVFETNHSFYDPGAPYAVAGVDTLMRREKELNSWAQTVRLWVIDEAHHLTKKNKWGRAALMFSNAYGLGVTATPGRADGLGLGKGADGIIDVLIPGANMRDLINLNFLTEYKIYAPPSDLNLSQVNITSSGDYSHKPLTAAVRKSHILGDIVKHYLKLARGKLGITFATDVKSATEIAAQYNAAGVAAEMICAKTNSRLRLEILRRFKNRKILQLVNVDLFGEGFDLPAIEVVSMARPTQSYNLYVQQFGRALRPMKNKKYAIIIDHVGNVARHGLPDSPRVWSLNARDKRRKSNTEIPQVKICINCTAVYKRNYNKCPYCNYCPEPIARSDPKFVDGDLVELDTKTLEKMRKAAAEIYKSDIEITKELMQKHCPQIGILAAVKRQHQKQKVQNELRNLIALYGGHNKAAGKSNSEGHRNFYHKYGIDVLTAQALNVKEANILISRLRGDL